MKIQILELPMEHVGEYSTTPYAIILSEVPAGRIEAYSAGMRALKDDVKDVRWFLVTPDEVEV